MYKKIVSLLLFMRLFCVQATGTGGWKVLNSNAVSPAEWSNWHGWQTCSVTCENGEQSRIRICHEPKSHFIRQGECGSDTEETRECIKGPCPIHGGWGAWIAWSACSVTCSNGNNSRSRTCDNPLPQLGGNDCQGEAQEVRPCVENFVHCPIDGAWNDWNTWQDCSLTCGAGGTKTRTRDCDNPAPQYNGKDCTGEETDSASCVAPIPNCPDISSMITSASTVYVPEHDSRYALEDSTSFYHAGRYLDPSINDWLQIDFLEEFPVYGAVIEGRYNYIPRFHSYEVRIGNQITQGDRQKITWNSACGGMPDSATLDGHFRPRNWPMMCPNGPIRGRYLTVQRPFEPDEYMEITMIHMLFTPKPEEHSVLHALFCFYVVDFHGGDINSGHSPSAWDCEEQCLGFSGCDTFTLLHNTCYLKKYAEITKIEGENLPFREIWSGRIGDTCRGFDFGG